MSIHDDMPFKWAAGGGHIEIVKFLADLRHPVTGDKRINVCANNNDAFRSAIDCDRLDVIKFLVTLRDPHARSFRIQS